MITEQELSKQLNRTIKSPIRIATLAEIGINTNTFLSYFQPLFENLTDDLYLVKENQIAFLKSVFTEELTAIQKIHQPYFYGETTSEVLQPWLSRLAPPQQELFKLSSTVTRQRSIATFTVEKKGDDYTIERITTDSFTQKVEDFRSWKRVFTQATPEAVEHDLFYSLLQKAFELVIAIHPNIQKLKITAHFMRTITQGVIKGENSPEGMHEDGAPYIISALVVNRKNITGGATQIFEKLEENQELIFNKELALGEFAFQADTGEEKTFGNDLWHYVTPIQPIDITKKGIRDIIGFDIEIID
ncbi:2OG-Fe dioxygenase [Tenacibaculum sp. 190524A02b]|uniref:2OG-Fe dioxygenase n=1 Tax=Tenacibaculum vairaonense TaxID=3137860 RepID=A0ABM9PN02_9FLAO